VPDEQRRVAPGGGGLSVSEHWRFLPPSLIPKHLRVHVPSARGESGLRCFRLGTGSFENGKIADGVALRVEKKRKGLLEPDMEFTIDAFQSALRATCDNWVLDETP
jgi:hypothetical protein